MYRNFVNCIIMCTFKIKRSDTKHFKVAFAIFYILNTLLSEGTFDRSLPPNIPRINIGCNCTPTLQVIIIQAITHNEVYPLRILYPLRMTLNNKGMDTISN